MRPTPSIVALVIAVAALSAVLWLGGLALAVQDQFFTAAKPPVEQKQPPANEIKERDEEIDIVALGDSLTRGTGDESGKGYVGYMVDELRKRTDEPIRVTNLAIRGLRSDGLLRQLGQPEIQRQIAMADLMVMTIGGNDLFRGGEALELNMKELNAAKRQYIANLDRIFALLRRLNSEAVIFAIGLYNPFSDLDDAKRTSAVVRDWNFASAEAAARYPNVVAVPTFDLFALHVNDYLYSDHFHPNKEGYKRIGERVASLITLTEEDRQ
ncbi:GDSL family lipase [Geobacillus sp. 46C-IIa]|uniref:SGNH/GDSL hydrolase family protein n=1 Tax=Geobacillus sp. 46C-IIa TaxID=1963025 RepID=UPI0009BE6743|nr:SGNH/GDSL hydrolase family protein [Geobacillus sp. 46C-IIa]OQP07219.1 GDSL family lipase [Geobacillus sp. 46C-IIa]QNU29544.1 SGNH/GDSL hydrolase family protein [Geobacillus sp. 46C-IIa]